MSLPKQVAAEEEYIIPVIGQTLFETLQTEANNSPTVTTATPLLQKVWAALAFLAYYKELPLLYTHISESGIKSVTNDKIQGAYFGQYKDLRLHIENEGLAALERLLVYMIATYSSNTAWTNSEAYKRLNKTLIRTGAEFNRYYILMHPNRTFYAIQPIVQEVEDQFINTSIGEDFFTALKAVGTPSADEKKVLELLRKSVANLTIYKSIIKKAVVIKPEGVTVMLSSGADTPNLGDGNAPAGDKMNLHHQTWQDGNSYLNAAVKLLNEKASDTVFTAFFESEYYKDPSIVKENINDSLTGTFVL